MFSTTDLLRFNIEKRVIYKQNQKTGDVRQKLIPSFNVSVTVLEAQLVGTGGVQGYITAIDLEVI